MNSIIGSFGMCAFSIFVNIQFNSHFVVYSFSIVWPIANKYGGRPWTFAALHFQTFRYATNAPKQQQKNGSGALQMRTHFNLECRPFCLLNHYFYLSKCILVDAFWFCFVRVDTLQICAAMTWCISVVLTLNHMLLICVQLCQLCTFSKSLSCFVL